MKKNRAPLSKLDSIGLALAIGSVFFIYAAKAGYVNADIVRYLIPIIILPAIAYKFLLLARDVKKDGQKDVSEVFGFKKYDNEAILREWQNQGDPLAHLDLEKRDKFRRLEDAYAVDPNPKTILAMAQICESFGWKEGAKLYYNQLLTDFKESKEAKEYIQNANRI